MNDRAVTLFEKYDLEIEKTRKGRGMLIATTPHGEIALTEYAGSVDRLLFVREKMEQIAQKFDGKLDHILPTTEGELYCSDYEGQNYIAKQYLDGFECNVLQERQCIEAMQCMAKLHMAMRHLQTQQPYQADRLLDDFKRKDAELVRARNFMRRLSRKDEFTLMFLRAYERYWQQTKLAQSFLDAACLQALERKQLTEEMYVHGDMNQHNIIMLQGKVMTFRNFEKLGAHLQMKDVYFFMRKILEKNHWSVALADQMIESYAAITPVKHAEYCYLYARFLYPEKFWKVANGYLNRRKSLPPHRQKEKLVTFEQREEERQLFLNKWLERCR